MRSALPNSLELLAIIDASDRTGLRIRVVDDDVASARESAHHEQVACGFGVRRAVEIARAYANARYDGHAVSDISLQISQRGQSCHPAFKSVLRRERHVERPIAAPVISRIVRAGRRIGDIDVPIWVSGFARPVRHHHGDARRTAPRIAAAAIAAAFGTDALRPLGYAQVHAPLRRTPGIAL